MNEKQLLNKLTSIVKEIDNPIIDLNTLDQLEDQELKLLDKLTKKQQISFLDKTHILLNDRSQLSGIFSGTDKGFGFVRIDEVEFSIFIPPNKTRFAISGDEVNLIVTQSADLDSNRGAIGMISNIVQRSKKEVIGEYLATTDPKFLAKGYIGYLKPLDSKIAKFPVYVHDPKEEIQLHDIVLAKINEYPDRRHPGAFLGSVKEVLGNKSAPGVDVLSVLKSFDLPLEFSNEVNHSAQEIPDKVLKEDYKGRVDLTKEVVVTIDGDDSKDFDDAVGLEILSNGNYKLGVHIADVSHYVTEGSILDQEAYKRGTSTYLVGEVVPMLPFKLSNGICSLNPDVERLTMTCEMEITSTGEIVSHHIFPSVIRSKGRLTYNLVNQLFAEAEVPDKYLELKELLNNMRSLHQVLNKMRLKRGAIEFEEKEPQILIDKDGHPTDIVIRKREDAEKMIESFMLAANETVAKDYYDKKLPFIFRVHEVPDEDKILDFLTFANQLGFKRDPNADPKSPKVMQAILEQAKGTKDEEIVIIKMLRSMKQAHYSKDPLGHYGIGAKYYTHFTSPIRRYPDLISHRLIHQYLDSGAKREEVARKWANKLDDISDQTSKRERVSIDVEREVIDLKKAEFMEDKVGEEFDGVISSALSFGLFIALPNTVEGLVHISTLKDDYYNFSEDLLALVGEKKRRMYRVGQNVRVKLVSVNTELHQVDFVLTDDNKVELAPKFEGVSDFTHPENRHFIKNNEKENK